MKRKIATVLAALTMPAAMTFAAGTYASASASHPVAGASQVTRAWGFMDGILCDTKLTPLCMSGYDGLNGVIKGFHYTQGNSGQDMVATQDDSACGGGLVTYNCPFIVGSGLNTMYHGRPILLLSNFANGMLYFVPESSAPDLIEGGAGDDFVQVGDLTGSGAGAQLIDVNWTNNDSGDIQDLCADPSGNQGDAIVEEGGGAAPNCTWTKHAS